MFETLKHLFELLCQGTVAGLIVVFVTHRLENRKAKELLGKHSMLISLEVQEHLVTLEQILKSGTAPQAVVPAAFSTETWTALRENLARLPMDDLVRLGAYYHSIAQLNNFAGAAHVQLTPPVKQNFEMCHLMGRAMKALLDRHWDCKNAKIHDALYRKYFAQAAAYQKNQRH